MPIRFIPLWVCFALAFSPGLFADTSGCPDRDAVLAAIEAIDPARGSRTTRFEVDAPIDLYERAAQNVGKPMLDRDGKTVRGVLVIERPIELIWKALNDEPHHALDGKYLPVRHSEVIDGTPRGQDRVLFQYFKKAGIGRWWVTRVEMNERLFADSQGKIWELVWEDLMDTVDTETPPIRSVAKDLSGLKRSYGAWLLLPVSPGCTLIEYFNHTEPGGFVSFAQGLMAKSSVRDTFEAIVRLGDEHLAAPGAEESFMRPDGTPLD